MYCPSLLNLEHLSLPTQKLATDGKINFGPDKKKHDYINIFHDFHFWVVSREFNLKSQLTVSLIIGFKESVSLIDRSVVVKELIFVPDIFSCRLLMICSHSRSWQSDVFLCWQLGTTKLSHFFHKTSSTQFPDRMIVFRAVLVSNIFKAACNIYGAGALIFAWQIISQLAGL